MLLNITAPLASQSLKDQAETRRTVPLKACLILLAMDRITVITNKRIIPLHWCVRSTKKFP
jgi:hypothetical protein